MLWCYDHNFLQFSAKKLAFFSKTNVMIKFLHNLALFWVKNANFFADLFCKNIFKIITSVPGYTNIKNRIRQIRIQAKKDRKIINRTSGFSKKLSCFCSFFDYRLEYPIEPAKRPVELQGSILQNSISAEKFSKQFSSANFGQFYMRKKHINLPENYWPSTLSLR
jgi:hypothetical protein